MILMYISVPYSSGDIASWMEHVKRFYKMEDVLSDTLIRSRYHFKEQIMETNTPFTLIL